MFNEQPRAWGMKREAPPKLSRILVIDDIREYDGAIHAKNSKAGIIMLENQDWDEVWLDHDLGGDDTIRPVVCWLEEHLIDLDCIWIITANPVGLEYIVSALKGKYRLRKKPGGFGMSLKNLKNV